MQRGGAAALRRWLERLDPRCRKQPGRQNQCKRMGRKRGRPLIPHRSPVREKGSNPIPPHPRFRGKSKFGIFGSKSVFIVYFLSEIGTYFFDFSALSKNINLHTPCPQVNSNRGLFPHTLSPGRYQSGAALGLWPGPLLGPLPMPGPLSWPRPGPAWACLVPGPL